LAGIQLDDLVWDVGGRVALSGSILVGPGEVAAVVAPPEVGAALADILVGLAPPVAGTVAISGRGALAARPDPRLVALVPVGGALLPQRTVAQNIAFGDRATANPQARENRVTKLAQLFRVAGVLRLHPYRLSPAQRLGVAAARALGSVPHAVVVEDRDGQPDCGPVIAALTGHDVAVIVITDKDGRARLLTDRVYHTTAGAPEQPAASDPQAGRDEAAEPDQRPDQTPVSGRADQPGGGLGDADLA
jgi:ABC-type polar amino acid transport system ATPase subunit